MSGTPDLRVREVARGADLRVAQRVRGTVGRTVAVVERGADRTVQLVDRGSADLLVDVVSGRLGPVAPVVYTVPGDVPGLQGWWKADSETSYVDGDPVGLFTDRSGKGRDLTRTGGNRPIFKTGAANGKPVLRFDGSNHYLAGAALSNFITASAFTLFVVVKVAAIGGADSAASPWTNPTIIRDAGQLWGFHLRNTGPTLQAYNWDGNADIATPAIATGVWMILEARHDAGNIVARRDGGAESTAASGNTNALTGLLNLSSSTSAATRLNGDIAEVAVWNVVVSAADRARLRAGFATKYGIPIAA